MRLVNDSVEREQSQILYTISTDLESKSNSSTMEKETKEIKYKIKKAVCKTTLFIQ